MPRIVTSRKRQRPATPPASAGDRIVRAAAIAVVVICAVFAAWRLLSPPEAAKPGAAPIQAGQKGQGRGVPTAAPETPEAARPDAASPSTDGRESGQRGQGRVAPAFVEIEDSPDDPPPTTPPAQPSGTPREREFFDNEIENTIASVSEPGAEFFGFPPGTEWEEDEILEVLRRPVVIEEDDDDAAIAAKERTAEFKAKALKAIQPVHQGHRGPPQRAGRHARGRLPANGQGPPPRWRAGGAGLPQFHQSRAEGPGDEGNRHFATSARRRQKTAPAGRELALVVTF